jgi:hypothetical protein
MPKTERKRMRTRKRNKKPKLKLAIWRESFHTRAPVIENSVKNQDRYLPLCG